MPLDIKQRVLRGNPKKPDGIERAFSRDEIENSSSVFVCDELCCLDFIFRNIFLFLHIKPCLIFAKEV